MLVTKELTSCYLFIYFVCKINRDNQTLRKKNETYTKKKRESAKSALSCVFVCVHKKGFNHATVVPTKSDTDVIFCLQFKVKQ